MKGSGGLGWKRERSRSFPAYLFLCQYRMTAEGQTRRNSPSDSNAKIINPKGWVQSIKGIKQSYKRDRLKFH
jgi:hypothetical protein